MIQERGWPGHYVCAHDCEFRRNTLITVGEKRIVVSTIGASRINGMGPMQTIGIDRYYETMAFEAVLEGDYWEADVSKEVPFKSKKDICAESPEELPKCADLVANEMHEAVVAEIEGAMNGNRNNPRER